MEGYSRIRSDQGYWRYAKISGIFGIVEIS